MIDIVVVLVVVLVLVVVMVDGMVKPESMSVICHTPEVESQNSGQK